MVKHALTSRHQSVRHQRPPSIGRDVRQGLHFVRRYAQSGFAFAAHCAPFLTQQAGTGLRHNLGGQVE